LFAAENLAPAELKKLRNKQRKARRKAELERQQAAQAQEKREQHNKSRQQGDAEPDAPQQDELVPEKLARVSTYLPAFLKNLMFSGLSANTLSYCLCSFRHTK
jgi:peptide alpha-N-acetyltransferase